MVAIGAIVSIPAAAMAMSRRPKCAAASSMACCRLARSRTLACQPRATVSPPSARAWAVGGLEAEVEQGKVGAALAQGLGEGGAQAAGGAGEGDGAPGQVVAGHGGLPGCAGLRASAGGFPLAGGEAGAARGGVRR